ncbi:MAG: hypothetical protein M1829_000856 [Trizodia sp. TS-e1964]|nr:MAG: hypothetical protein M1829_000856 [Trizodia sp. TS-e1964]
MKYLPKPVPYGKIPPLRKAGVLSPDVLESLPPKYPRAPVSYGIMTWWGYHPMIRTGNRLPRANEQVLRALHDFDHEGIFRICCRHTERYPLLEEAAPIEIATLQMLENRHWIKGMASVRIRMEMNPDLRGLFTVIDRFTKQKTHLEFDGRRAFSL